MISKTIGYNGTNHIFRQTHMAFDGLNIVVVNFRFARGESRRSFDLLKSLRRVEVFDFPKQQILKA